MDRKLLRAKLKGHVETWKWDSETGKKSLEIAKFIHPGLVGSILLKFGNTLSTKEKP